MAIKDIMKTSMQNFANEAYKRFAEKDEIRTYSIAQKATANTGAFKTYQLVDGAGAAVTGAAEIDIPKDYLVKSAELKTATSTDNFDGIDEGDVYIDFTVNSVDGSGNESHIRLNVKSLVDAYTNGNGIELNNNTFSLKVAATGANGLSVDADGLKLGLATDAAAGALSAADHQTFAAKQEQIIVRTATGDGNAITGVSLNADNKTIELVKGETFVKESDIEELTAAECVTIFNTAKTNAESTGD